MEGGARGGYLWSTRSSLQGLNSHLPHRKQNMKNMNSVAGHGMSFNLLLHAILESKAILEARAEFCSRVHVHTLAHDKSGH